MSILTGTIQSLVDDKGFGFIRPSNGGPDIFFHRSATDDTFRVMEAGQEVEYELDESSDRPRANAVRIKNAGSMGAARGRQRLSHRDKRSSELQTRHNEPREFGFVTKLWRHELKGFISSVKHGPELVFEARAVSGEKRFSDLKIGEYVCFVRSESSDPAQSPVATSVTAVERETRTPKLNLPKHRRARGKKPSWR